MNYILTKLKGHWQWLCRIFGKKIDIHQPNWEIKRSLITWPSNPWKTTRPSAYYPKRKRITRQLAYHELLVQRKLRNKEWHHV